MDTELGIIGNRYQLLESVGMGGTSTVYTAQDARLDRVVAVKIITYNRPHETPQINKQRFEQEIELLCTLQHPHIVSIWDYGEHDDAPYFVMGYFPNGTLKEKLEELKQPIFWQEAIQTLLPVAQGLSYAHKQGIIHRDIKPSNILLSLSGEPVLSDFGIARILERIDGPVTETGARVGSSNYMAPEQKKDPRLADARSDIFSLGLVLYEMITGYKPINSNFSAPLQNPQKFNSSLPKELNGIFLKALAGNPKDRYQNMDDFILALENVLRTKGGTKKPLMTFRMIGLVIIALLIIAGVFFSDSIKTLVTTVSSSPSPSVVVDLEEEITLPSGIVMRLIPPGEFTMGSDEGNDEGPVHSVSLDAFYMDKFEITNAQYKTCVEKGGCQPPKDFSSNTQPSYFDNPEFEDYPVIYVDWNMAKTYCEWRGGRLPTEAEWEKAARGTDARTYPWGEILDCEHANYGQDISESCVGDTESVGSYESGKSVYGIYDMAGNVSEWVADWYQHDYYKSLGNSSFNPQGPESGEARVLRGGSWSFSAGDVRPANRNGYSETVANDNIGFRCAQDPQ